MSTRAVRRLMTQLVSGMLLISGKGISHRHEAALRPFKCGSRFTQVGSHGQEKVTGMEEHSRRPTSDATTGDKRTIVPIARSVALWLVIASMGHRLVFAADPPAAFSVDVTRSVHTMASGMGASWHAIGPTAYWYDGLIGQDATIGRAVEALSAAIRRYRTQRLGATCSATPAGWGWTSAGWKSISECTNRNAIASIGKMRRCRHSTEFSTTASRAASTYYWPKCGKT